MLTGHRPSWMLDKKRVLFNLLFPVKKLETQEPRRQATLIAFAGEHKAFG